MNLRDAAVALCDLIDSHWCVYEVQTHLGCYCDMCEAKVFLQAALAQPDEGAKLANMVLEGHERAEGYPDCCCDTHLAMESQACKVLKPEAGK